MQTKTTEPKLGINLQRAIKQFNDCLAKYSIAELFYETDILDIPESIKDAIITARTDTRPWKSHEEIIAEALIIQSRRLNGCSIGGFWASDIVYFITNPKKCSDTCYQRLVRSLSTIKQETIDKYVGYLKF